MKILDTTGCNSSSGSAPSRQCEVAGCSESTREGKPYCSKHVDHNPYVRSILQEMARRDAEDEAIRRGDSLPINLLSSGVTSQAILQYLDEHGGRTRERICKDLQVDQKVIDGYLNILSRHGIVVLGCTVRGNITVSLRRRKVS